MKSSAKIRIMQVGKSCAINMMERFTNPARAYRWLQQYCYYSGCIVENSQSSKGCFLFSQHFPIPMSGCSYNSTLYRVMHACTEVLNAICMIRHFINHCLSCLQSQPQPPGLGSHQGELAREELRVSGRSARTGCLPFRDYDGRHGHGQR